MNLTTSKARPMLDELKKGRYPSFVKEIEKSAAKNAQAETLLDLLEDSYEEKRYIGSMAVSLVLEVTAAA